jgi:hypothetical protein
LAPNTVTSFAPRLALAERSRLPQLRANEGGHRAEERGVAVDGDHRPHRLFHLTGREPLQRGRHDVDQVVHAEDGLDVGFS